MKTWKSKIFVCPRIKLHRLFASLLLTLSAAGPGCTQFRVTQTDESPDERIIRTEIRASAWFSSAQNVSKLKALQTDKTQSFGSDTIGQHGTTNAVQALNSIVRILELLRPAP